METVYNWLKKVMLIVFGLAFVLCTGPAQASMKEIKAYKAAFPETKPKCIDCHTAAMPKKDDGQHDVNDYGKAVMAEAAKDAAADAEPTADTFKTVGKIEDFQKK